MTFWKLSTRTIFFLVLLLGAVGFLGKHAFACDNCGNRGVGARWCNGTSLMECRSCSGRCGVYSGGVLWGRDDCCPRRDSGECDFSCCGNRKYSQRIGSCSTPPEPFHAPTLVSPANNSTVGSTSVTLRWNHDGVWGDSRPQDRHFKVYVRPDLPETHGWADYLLTRIYDVNARSYVYTGTVGITYQWRIGADNGPGQKNSETWAFTINNPQSIDGYIFETAGDCMESNPAGAAISGVTGQVQTDRGDSGSVSSGAHYEIPGLGTGYTFDGLCFSGSIPSTSSDWRYDLACANSSVSFAPDASNCLWASSTVTLNNPLEVNFGYRRISTIDAGWFTSINGEVFGGGGIVQTLPTSPTSTFSGYLIDPASSMRAFVFSRGDIDATTGDGDERIVADGDGGFVENLDSDVVFVSPNFNLAPPEDATSISDLSSSLDPDTTYAISVGDLNSVLSSGAVDCSSVVSSDGVVVLYVTGDASTSLNINNEFCAGSSDRRIVLMSQVPVSIDRSLGVALPDVTSPSNVSMFLMSSHNHNIDIPGTSDADTDPDTTLMVEGSLVSSGGVSFERNRGVDNHMYPAIAVKYDPYYLYKLTEQERASTELNKSGVFVTSVEWSVQ